MSLMLKVFGVLSLIVGFTLTIAPELFEKLPSPIDSYQMTEKRVKWGIVIGVGLLTTFHTSWSSLGITATALLTALIFGVILARLTGMVLDGFILKQLWWLLIEIAALILFGFLYYKQRQ